MPPIAPSPELTVTRHQARRFLLAHHRLLPPRSLRGKHGVLEYVGQVRCIQNDPINIVGQNSHLVLQSRVHGYTPAILDALLYRDRRLLDGMDKQMSIYPVEDWPDLALDRGDRGDSFPRSESTAKAAKLTKWVKREIESRGPLSSLDLED